MSQKSDAGDYMPPASRSLFRITSTTHETSARGRKMGRPPDEELQSTARLTDLYRRLRLDSLTEIFNRENFRSELRTLAEQGVEMAVVLLDLDHFKKVNDTYGQSAGDHVIQTIAKHLSDAFDNTAVLGRMGGDAFAIVLRGHFDSDALADIERRTMEAVRAPIAYENHLLHIRASVGIALYPEHGNDGGTLLTNAALALSEAKNNGRNAVCVFHAPLRDALISRQRLLDELRIACEQKQFELHYQPQFELRSHRITGAEALLRWRHPRRGLIQPVEFLETLENSTLAGQVGRWILEVACRQAAVWQHQLPDGFLISINLFGSQLLAEGFDTELLNILQVTGLAPRHLELEITENTLLNANADLYKAMRRLYDAGIGIALDDYGTGYASLSLLKRLPITRLKIDRSFIADITHNDDDAVLVRTILFLGRNFDLSVVAEGIETVEQETRLLQLGCQQGQGYLYSEPLSADGFAARFLEQPECPQR
jgi:diguanylate cyclase (GGDEF)-like protein